MASVLLDDAASGLSIKDEDEDEDVQKLQRRHANSIRRLQQSPRAVSGPSRPEKPSVPGSKRIRG